MSCSCVLVSSTMEYLSKERTLPESLAPFSRCTVMCLPAARATFRNDSCTLMTDMNNKAGSRPPLWRGRRFVCLPNKIMPNHLYVQYIIGLQFIGSNYGSPPVALFLRGGRNRKLHPRR